MQRWASVNQLPPNKNKPIQNDQTEKQSFISQGFDSACKQIWYILKLHIQKINRFLNKIKCQAVIDVNDDIHTYTYIANGVQKSNFNVPIETSK